MSSAASATIALKPGVGQVGGAVEAVEPESPTSVTLKPGIRQVGEDIEVYEAKAAELSPFLQTRLEDIRVEYGYALQYAKRSFAHAVRCGDALRALKADLGHGNWIPFVEAYLPFTRQAASEWMRYSEEVEAGNLDMETVDSISEARRRVTAAKKAAKQLAAPMVEKVPCPGCGEDAKPEDFKRGLPEADARRLGVCQACGAPREERPAPKPYVVDTERKRDLANKAEERFWAVTTHITGLEEICAQKDASLGEVLHLDRVAAVADHDQLREQQRELGRGIRRARELYDELGELLEAC